MGRIDHANRKCEWPGCNELGRLTGKTLKDGTPTRNKLCWVHVCEDHDSMGAPIYRKYRKDYCENIDGRLGFKCDYKIQWEGQLDVDHIDGNHNNNEESNLQTLCKNCHALKTNINEDWKDKTINTI